ncbi:hypothetical protein BU23DRAFT_569067 [Bimuria novae-zelandiae CBS 107.79]|uniref:Uncharacterized protein n=1 Tax=Bimuria novae-zelandiae CBS 107.79 TaxID=1447943 RepID=A0A6A5V937_9PLEO|nr:hypothetical protein BU23DRAFT_569067 [Bimuria novae-zelandiae CBS 107.79]
MHSLVFGLTASLFSIACGRSAVIDRHSGASLNHDVAREFAAKRNAKSVQDDDGTRLYGCVNPQWSGGCTYFPAQDGACHNARLQNQQGEWTNELYSVGPNRDTKCFASSMVDCNSTSKLYPTDETEPNDGWSFSYLGYAELGRRMGAPRRMLHNYLTRKATQST